MKQCNSVRVTTLIDNDVWKSGLASTWGLSLYVEMDMEQGRRVILMDTSGSFETLSKNTSKLGVDLSDIESIFISHWHGDHCGCLSQVLPMLRQAIPVYVPSESPSGIRDIKQSGGTPRICSEPVEFMDGAMSTGDLGGEHSLFMNVREKGLVVLTGCSHPGIINIVKRARRVSGVSRVCAVIGGFHISGVYEGKRVGEFMDEIGVELVSPCHCTGADSRSAIADIMGVRYVRNGSGRVFLFK
jgi:7,8-dihydropterin-6-yl-methyl-4-(beta-D-ribofuranosyl)aminobenzene 5'-phosphate synthase